MTVTSADLIDRYGVNSVDVARWVADGSLDPVDGGGRGCPYEFNLIDDYVVQALVQWRHAVRGDGVGYLVAHQVRQQLHDLPTEATATVTVTVDLGPGVTVTLETRTVTFCCSARQARQGSSRPGAAWQGAAGLGEAGVSWLDTARPGAAWRGEAGKAVRGGST